MEEYITRRVLNVAQDILIRKDTIRNIAKLYGVSKSTVHKDLSERLEEVDKLMYEEVKELLEYNKSVRHLRGGNSTKLKYLNVKP